ncbi:uncharacterized protein LOC143859643 [Tasmannia lanceolata]|uniref:uncharacterized protein LOC143859643 n=1 Tax=Tasmannia lanceolata TaxID=3420 RepID=UPI004062CBA3
MKNGLSTRDNRPFLGLMDDRKCILCKQEFEAANHLYFNCSFTKWIWKSIPWRLGNRRNPAKSLMEEEIWLRNKFKGRCQGTKTAQITFSASIYRISRERNMRIFENKCPHKKAILLDILSTVRRKNIGMALQDVDNPRDNLIASNFGYVLCPTKSELKWCSWNKLDPDIFKINTDASLDSEGGGI